MRARASIHTSILLVLALTACGGEPEEVDQDQDGYPATSDCNDLSAVVNPGAAEVCDGLDNNCNTQIDEGFTLNTYYADLDGDSYGDSLNALQSCTTPSGYVTDSSDCNDSSASIKPGANEQLCNGADENCNGLQDDHPDLDSDGYDQCSQGVSGADAQPVDCDDSNAGISPSASEQCNQRDDNCNAQVDEGITLNTYYQDNDVDGFGNPSVSVTDCTAPAGYTTQAGDCNDGNAAINPSATEAIGDGIDSNCNGFSDGIVLVGGTAGQPGYAGDGGSVGNAAFNNLEAISVDPQGNIFVADTNNHRIRKITPQGIITTVAGNGTQGYSGDNGPATSAKLNLPGGVSADGAGNLYVADTGNHRVRTLTITANSIIRTLAGNGEPGSSGDGGTAENAQLNTPTAVTADATGNVFIADTGNNKIRKIGIPPTRTISTFAGTGTAGFSGDGGQAISAQLNGPEGLTVDSGGNIYISDTGNHRIRRVISINGKISTFAGTGASGYSGDGGPAVSAQLNSPLGVFSRLQEDLYIADSGNHCVRRISVLTGNINLVAGTCGSAGYSGNEGNANQARMNTPYGMVIDGSGYLVIVDTGNEVIRQVIW